MPKKDMDYSKTIIYKIVSNDLNITDVYVGHTTNFIQRKALHKSSCNNINDKSYNLKIYQIIRANGGFENWTMVEIEKYPCNDINEAISRERYHFELQNAKLNTLYPGRNYKEYYENNKEKIKQNVREYYEENKDKVKETKKKYREDNKDIIKEKKSKVCICECGCEYTNCHKARHLRTEKHQKLIKEIKT